MTVAYKTLTSITNSKLGTNVPCFNIPAKKTCPGSTVQCRKDCYASKGFFMFASNKKRHKWNWQESKKDNFTDRMIAEISGYSFNGINRFRIHSSGDFYNQEYLNKWYKIINKFKQMQFVAYTRSHMLDFRNKPFNLNLYYSTDDTTIHYPTYKGLMPETKIVYTDDAMAQSKKVIPCVSKCNTCNICYLPKQSSKILFKKH
jgi:hypothetical protein